MMVGWQMFCIFETGQNVFGISDTGTYFFCEMFFYLSSFELIFSEKTNICCCELKHFRLFPVNPRPSPRCCRLRGNRLWFCAETPCQTPHQACHTSLPHHHTRPHQLARLPQQACHRTTSAFEVRLATPPHQACPATTQANTRLGQVKVNCSHHLKSCRYSLQQRQGNTSCHATACFAICHKIFHLAGHQWMVWKG